ncbi:MAG: hypothetical protein QOJ54_2287 [Aliidongia sp.]|jgi:hypothetical protein|nr:hypothetical protein [Aliidongia sp.]
MSQTSKPTLDARRAFHGHGYRNELSGWLRVMLGVLLLIAAVAAVGFALGWPGVDDLVTAPTTQAELAPSQSQ